MTVNYKKVCRLVYTLTGIKIGITHVDNRNLVLNKNTDTIIELNECEIDSVYMKMKEILVHVNYDDVLVLVIIDKLQDKRW